MVGGGEDGEGGGWCLFAEDPAMIEDGEWGGSSHARVSYNKLLFHETCILCSMHSPKSSNFCKQLQSSSAVTHVHYSTCITTHEATPLTSCLLSPL